MAQDFTIIKVSSNPPTPWKNGISYYKVMLEGVPTPQEIGKKSVPTVGQTVYGDIIDGKFKRANKEFTPNDDGFSGSTPPGSKPAYQPKDEAAIQAMWSIGQAIAMGFKPSQIGMSEADGIEEGAKTLFAMVSRVKAGQAVADTTGFQAGDVVTGVVQPAPDLVPVENYDNVPTDLEDEVNLDDIPF